MDILILGNGFDLAHDLNTKYKDFLQYCQKKYPTNIIGEDKSNNFLYNNLWVKHFLNKTLAGDNWIDLEKEIYNVIVKLSTFPYFKENISSEKYKDIIFLVAKNDPNFKFDNVKIYFSKPINPSIDYFQVEIPQFIDFLYEQLRDFVKEFEKYLDEIITTQSASETKYQLPLLYTSIPNINNYLYILNFNYTNTLTKLYKNSLEPKHRKFIQEFYVHGEIDSNNIVLGTQFYDNKNTNIPPNFNIFRKYNQRHKYNTIESYQSLLHIIKTKNFDEKRIFHVVGHSLDVSDAIILKHIFLANKNSKINIYYHNEEVQEKLINNITEIIGEEEVMEKVRFIYQHDLKRGILIPQTELQEILT
jgi:hypothetical protein